MGDAGVLVNSAVLVDSERIVAVGPQAELLKSNPTFTHPLPRSTNELFAIRLFSFRVFAYFLLR